MHQPQQTKRSNISSNFVEIKKSSKADSEVGVTNQVKQNLKSGILM